jgi:hypothetical protein
LTFITQINGNCEGENFTKPLPGVKIWSRKGEDLTELSQCKVLSPLLRDIYQEASNLLHNCHIKLAEMTQKACMTTPAKSAFNVIDDESRIQISRSDGFGGVPGAGRQGGGPGIGGRAPGQTGGQRHSAAGRGGAAQE